MDTFQAIAEPRRREIIELIAKRGSLTATDISGNFKVSPPAISQHLKILREAKLIDMEKRAQQRIYTLNTKSFSDIEDWLVKLKEKWEQKFLRLDNLLNEKSERR